MTLDLTDLTLEIQGDFLEIVQEFAEDILEPKMTNALAIRWITMTDDQKEMIRETMPKTYAKILRTIK